MLNKEKQQDEKSTNRIKFIVYLFAIIALLSGVVNVVSKYVHTNKEQAVVQAQEFYFESNLLTEEGAEYELSADTTTININLRNFPDKFRYSQGDIDVLIEVFEGGNVIQTITAEFAGGYQCEDDYGISVEAGKTYIVKATGKKGFQKVLTATFKVESEENVIYKTMEQTNEYVLLTVWTKKLSGDVNITIPGGLIPDNTYDALENVKTGDGEFTDTVNFQKPYSSYRYRFFKSNDNNYNVNDFSVTCAEVSATEKIPEE